MKLPSGLTSWIVATPVSFVTSRFSTTVRLPSLFGCEASVASPNLTALMASRSVPLIVIVVAEFFTAWNAWFSFTAGFGLGGVAPGSDSTIAGSLLGGCTTTCLYLGRMSSLTLNWSWLPLTVSDPSESRYTLSSSTLHALVKPARHHERHVRAAFQYGDAGDGPRRVDVDRVLPVVAQERNLRRQQSVFPDGGERRSEMDQQARGARALVCASVRF